MIDATIAHVLQTHLFRESRRQLRGLRPSDGEWLGERAYNVDIGWHPSWPESVKLGWARQQKRHDEHNARNGARL